MKIESVRARIRGAVGRHKATWWEDNSRHQLTPVARGLVAPMAHAIFGEVNYRLGDWLRSRGRSWRLARVVLNGRRRP